MTDEYYFIGSKIMFNLIQLKLLNWPGFKIKLIWFGVHRWCKIYGINNIIYLIYKLYTSDSKESKT